MMNVASTLGISRGGRSAGWAGIAFVALSTVWAVLQVALSPPELGRSTRQEFASFYGDQSNRISLILAALALGLAGFALLWFIGGLSTVLRRAEADVETLAATAIVGGTVLAALLFVFNAVQVAVPWALEESDFFRLDPSAAQLFEGLSYLLAIHGALAAAAFVGATSQVFRRARIHPTWLAWGGLVIAALNFLLAVPIHGVSLVLVLPWVLIVSVLMLAQSGRDQPALA
jgi:hypothetical protein